MKGNIIFKRIFGLYLFFVAILLTWRNPNSLPPMPLRITYLVTVIVSVMNINPNLFPITFFSLVVFSMIRFAPSYMVCTQLNVFIVAVLVSVFYSRYKIRTLNSAYHLVVMSLYMLLVNIICGGNFEESCLAGFSLFLIIPFVNNYNSLIKPFIAFFIVLVTIVSSEFMLFGRLFTERFSTDDITRMGWMDPNVFGCILGIGIMCALLAFLFKLFTYRYANLMIAIAVLITSIAFLLNASRGATFALSISSFAFLLISPARTNKKLITIFLGIVMLGILYSIGYFDTLMSRMTLDNVETGGERTIIWETKTSIFLNDYNFIRHLFGLGNEDACFLGYGYYLEFHSDYFAMFVKYGVVGLLMLIYMIYYPLRVASHNKNIIIIFLLYLCLCIGTLDLINRGHVAFFLFYFLLLVLGKCEDLNAIKN